MEKNTIAQMEAHDFMSVESFSQLPFIRPAQSPHKEKGIRLFGKEFGTGDTNVQDESFTTHPKEVCVDNSGGGESTRKFECQYCCRNFPTSQALGGHQNAHKRERQHAKRAHIQSAMMHASGLAEGSFPPHVYGLMNYHHRLGSVARPTLGYHDNWTKSSSAYTSPSSGRLYGGSSYGSYSQTPINGSPLALWRIPAAHGFHSFNRDGGSIHPRPLLGNLEFKNPQVMSSATSQTLLGYNEESKAKMQDHVSLDLHL